MKESAHKVKHDLLLNFLSRKAFLHKQPFFLYFAMTSPHTPINPSKRFLDKSGVSKYADFLMKTDFSIGRIVRAIDNLGMAENTLVIFTADNRTSPMCNFEALEQKNVHLREHWQGHKADSPAHYPRHTHL